MATSRRASGSAQSPKLDGSAGVYLFCGPESFLRRLYLNRLISRVLGGDGGRADDEGSGQSRPRAAGLETAVGDSAPGMAISDFDGATASLAEVLDELRTLPFLAPRRVVILHDADGFISEHRSRLEDYVASPCPTGVLVLLAERSQPNTRLHKAVAAGGGLVGCAKLAQSELAGWIRDRAEDAYGKRIDDETAGLLADLVGGPLDRLDSELAKLATYLGDERKTITTADVDELVANQRMHDAFELTGAIASKDAAAALDRWEDMLSKDRNVEFSGVGLIGWQVRQLLRARLLRRQGLPREAILRRLRLPVHVRDRFVEQVNQFSERRLRSLLTELVRVDLAAKTGGAPPRRGIEQFIVHACEVA